MLDELDSSSIGQARAALEHFQRVMHQHLSALASVHLYLCLHHHQHPILRDSIQVSFGPIGTGAAQRNRPDGRVIVTQGNLRPRKSAGVSAARQIANDQAALVGALLQAWPRRWCLIGQDPL